MASQQEHLDNIIKYREYYNKNFKLLRLKRTKQEATIDARRFNISLIDFCLNCMNSPK